LQPCILAFFFPITTTTTTQLRLPQPSLPPLRNMPYGDLDYEDLTRILTESFNVLAEQVEVLNPPR
jgi:hypothetical protein